MPNYFTELQDGPSGPSYKVKDEEAHSSIAVLSDDYFLRNGMKNMVKLTEDSSTSRAVVYTIDKAAGTIAVNGTNSSVSDTSYTFAMIVPQDYFLPGKYKLNGHPGGNTNVAMRIRYNNGSGNVNLAIANDIGDVAFEITEAIAAAATGGYNIMVAVGGGATADNVVLRPQIRYATVSDGTFEKRAMTNNELTEAVKTIPAPQIQSDWNQSDNTALDFIKNKPEISAGLPPLPIDGWVGLTSFYGNDIWTDGTNIYYSNGSNQYVLDKATSTWSTKTWTGLTSFYGSYIWTDGTNIYYSNNANQYVLDKATSTWSTKTWTGLTSFRGDRIWTDGTNIYYSNNANQYVLDKSTSTWSTKTWTGLTSFNGEYVWTDGTDIYFSSNAKQYVLDKSTSTWSTKTWTGLTAFNGGNIWTDGTNIYYSDVAGQYVLDKSTSTWSTKTWSGLPPTYGYTIWTDGTNIYYSDVANQYVLYNGAWYKKTGTTEENYIAAALAALYPSS